MERLLLAKDWTSSKRNRCDFKHEPWVQANQTSRIKPSSDEPNLVTATQFAGLRAMASSGLD
ncbi:hypothetical protein [Neorhodopirellula pilleata]|uniref:hypothetical protein n=1 Tax=Neorhodopirellula pilleata TaxID=2714738 RepID=UPI0018CDB63E|nr:hypothetical protein [Neorhodopirellula pilleata]